MKKGRVSINILTKDRPTELGLLLQSLRTQTYQAFDIFILDDCSGTPIQTYSFLRTLFERLRYEGHYIEIFRNQFSKGISLNRQKLAEDCRKFVDNEYICRLDDDTILEKDYLELLVAGIETYGFDLMSGVTPPMANGLWKREVSFVSPIINRVVLDNEGKFVINGDDCGHVYLTKTVLPTHHFRSCALYKALVHDKVSYEDNLTHCGFREEEFFSFRMMLAGYTLGVNTQAIAWHLMTPSGGDRRQNYADLSLQNQKLLNKFVRKMYSMYGDFIETYNKKLGIQNSDDVKYASIFKNTNLIYYQGEE